MQLWGQPTAALNPSIWAKSRFLKIEIDFSFLFYYDIIIKV